jgi:hypothetical protein
MRPEPPTYYYVRTQPSLTSAQHLAELRMTAFSALLNKNYTFISKK